MEKLITNLRRLPRGTIIRKDTKKWTIWNDYQAISPVKAEEIGDALQNFMEIYDFEKGKHQKL